jgi:hypothetical protein
MQPYELDRLLSKQGSINPSPDFAAAVMSAVRREAGIPRGIGFPWKPVVFGAASAALSIVAGVGQGGAAPGLALAVQPSVMTLALNSWAAHVAAGAANPAVSALMLSVVVALVPLAVYEGYQRMRD